MLEMRNKQSVWEFWSRRSRAMHYACGSVHPLPPPDSGLWRIHIARGGGGGREGEAMVAMEENTGRIACAGDKKGVLV
jgi:hypothetical protein